MDIKQYENYHEQKEHGSLTFPYNTYLCSIPLDFSEVPLHWHEEMEIIYVKKGTCLISVEFDEQTIEGGEFVIVLPGQLHGIRQYENTSSEYENILFRPEILFSKKEEESAEKYIEPILQQQVVIHSFYTKNRYATSTENNTSIRALLDTCDALSAARFPGYELLIKAQLLCLMYELFANASARHTKKQIISHEAMKTTIKYVELHYMEKLTIEEMADVTGFSSSHFMKYFKQHMGQSFIDYLNDYRLTMAARLLLSSDASILAIAEETGFTNLSYFNRTFKRRFGMTPREYRKK